MATERPQIDVLAAGALRS